MLGFGNLGGVIMVLEDKAHLEIKYCSVWNYFNVASWIGAEFNGEFGGDIRITLTPGTEGRLEVYLDGSLIFDRKKAGKYPGLPEVNQMKLDAQEQIPALAK